MTSKIHDIFFEKERTTKRETIIYNEMLDLDFHFE